MGKVLGSSTFIAMKNGTGHLMNNKLLRIVSSPVYAVFIVLPLLLPDFYLWKTDFDVLRHHFLVYFWLFGVFLKYVSLFLSILACMVNHKNTHLTVAGLYILFFVVIMLSSLAHGFGLAGVKDTWNQMLLGLPVVLYFPSVITAESRKEDDKKILSWILAFAACIALITVAFYIVFPKGFGELFDSCQIAALGGRICGTFIGRHTDTILYGVLLLVLTVLVILIDKSSAPVWLVLPLSVLLLFFSTSVTAKLVSILLLVSFVVILLLRNNSRFVRVSRIITAPVVVHFIAFVIAFLLPLFPKMTWFAKLMLRLHRDPTMSGRAALYDTAIKTFSQHPVFGIGYSEKYYPSIMINNFGTHLSFPHNSYLQILMESGLVGFVIFTLFIFATVQHHKYEKLNAVEPMLNILFLGSVIAGSTSGDFFVGRFYLIAVLIYCAGAIQDKLNGSESKLGGLHVEHSGSLNRNKKSVLLFMAKVDIGGIEHMYLSVLPRLTNRYNFILLCYGEGENEMGREFSELGCTILRIDISRFKHPIRFIRIIRMVIAEYHISVFHSNVGFSTFFGLVAAWLSHVPVRIAHAHSSEYGVHNNPLNSLFQFLCKLSCHFFATIRINIGGASKEPLFFEFDKSVFVPNGIDMDKFTFDPNKREAGRSKFGLSADTEVLLHVGRFSRPKNHEFLIKVFEAFHRVHPDSRLVLAGNGPLMDSVREQVEDAHLSSSVIFLGALPDVSDLYSVADVLVFPSIYEGLPVTLVEAQANGIPVFASDVIDRVVDLSDNITFLPLEDGPEGWARLLPYKPIKRQPSKRSQKLNEFDSSSTAERIAQIYEGKLR